MDGPWRITVIGKDAVFDQRAVIRASYGTSILAGRVGEFLDVREDAWELELEHSWDGRWWPNVRVRPGPVQSSASGTRSRVIRSKDADWTGGHPEHPNFVLRLESLETAAPREGVSAGAPMTAARAAFTGTGGSVPTTAGQGIPVATQSLRTSSGPGTASRGPAGEPERVAQTDQAVRVRTARDGRPW